MEDTPDWLKSDFDIQTEYLKLANFYENEFFEDLESLNIKRPDGITRVSEYVPEIITFIEKIIENGYAYQSGGDVYFDLQAFTKAGFTYNKCSPATLSEEELNSLLAEGEGQLSAGTSKKNTQDFALWKTSKVIFPLSSPSPSLSFPFPSLYPKGDSTFLSSFPPTPLLSLSFPLYFLLFLFPPSSLPPSLCSPLLHFSFFFP